VSDTTGTGSGSLAVLAAGAAALARAADLDTALGVIVEAGAAATGATVAAVFGQDVSGHERPDDEDPGRQRLELLLTLGLAEDAVAALADEVATDPGHPVNVAVLDRSGTLGRVAHGPDGATTTSVDLPLVVSAGGGVEDCVGVLTFGWAGEHAVDTAEETLLVGIADLAAVALATFRLASLVAERAEWYERVAHTDALTGLANERTVQRVLELEVARAARQGSEVSVAVFDIDEFTQLNTQAGARAGDLALRQVASILAETVRLVDTIGRTGADEFVLVAPGSAGVTVARRVMQGIAQLEPVAGHDVTVSAGVARFPQDGTDGPALVAAARGALEGVGGRAAIGEATGEADRPA
jgi:diguanylate cyclase (GGDEF)-like protein